MERMRRSQHPATPEQVTFMERSGRCFRNQLSRREKPANLNSIESSGVVESQATAVNNVLAFPVLPVDPPREVQQQLLKDPLEEEPVRAAEHLFLDFVSPPCGPGVHRGIHVIESPLVGGELPVRG